MTMEHENAILNENAGKEKIDVLLIEPGKYPRMVSIDSGLESLQKAVDGDIQAVYYWDDPVALICNEEGKINGLRANRAVYDEDGEMVDVIVGNFLITGIGEEDFSSLPKDMKEKYEKMFHSPEAFFKLAGKIIALPTDPDRETRTKGKTSPGVVL